MNNSTCACERCAVCGKELVLKWRRLSHPWEPLCYPCASRIDRWDRGARNLRAFPSVRTHGEARTPQTDDDGFYGCYSD